MSHAGLLSSLCLGVLLATSAASGAVAAGPAATANLLPAATVINEKPSPSQAPAAAEPPAAPMPTVFAADVKVPTITAVNSSMSDAELIRALSGDVASEADKLATLSATSIRVPQITVTMTVTPSADKPASTIVYHYKNIDLEGVSNGIAQSVTIDGVDASIEPGTGGPAGNTHFEAGKMSAENFDIASTLGFYGYGPAAGGATVKPLYKNFSLAGGGFSATGGHCSFGAVSSASFSARPLKLSFGDLMKLVTSPEMQKPHPSPDFITKLVLFYADFFSAVQSSPATLDGIDCAGTDDRGRAFTLKTGMFSIDGFGNDRYPAVTIDDFAFSGDDGLITLDNATFKSVDLSAPIALIEGAAKPLTENWFTTNARKLIPAFEGFAFSGLKLDVPDTENAGERIKGGVGDFDLTLGDYLDGIPMRISSTTHHAAFDVPAAIPGQSDDYAELRQMGISHLDMGYDFAVHHDAATKSLVIDKVGVTGANLGSAVLSGTLGNIDDLLFSANEDQATAAGLAVTFKSLKLDLADAGLGDIVFKLIAADQGTNLAAARTSMSSMAQGLVLLGLASNPDAKGLGDAIGQFLSAAGKSLTVGVAAKAPDGIPMSTLAAASDNPQTLAGQVSISATAK